MLGRTNQIFKKLFYAGIVATVLLAGAAGKATSAPDSNSIVVDDIEFYIETDKSFYYLGDNVQILYRLTKLGPPSVTIPCSEHPPTNIIILKENQRINVKYPLRFPEPVDLWLPFLFPYETTFNWDMNDFNDVPVEPGIYDLLGVIYDGIGLPDVGVRITILQEPLCGDPLHPYPVGDLNLDCYVDLLDVALMALHWLECAAPECD